MIGKQDTNTGSEGEISTRTNNVMRYTPGGKGNNIAELIDLQSMIISLLMDKPNGLTLKALEKAVEHIVPNPIEKIKPILRKVASYKSPRRYILLPGVHSERFKNPQTESGRSPDPQLLAHEEFHDETPAQQGGFKVPIVDSEEPVQLNSKVEEESKTLEKINVQHASPSIFGEKKGSDPSEGQGGSSNDGGSDSDNDNESDSSDCGNRSESHSRSPVERGSGSSSDSENDASSKDKEGLDEDGEKESKYNTELSDKRVSLLIPIKSADRRSLQYEILEKRDDHEYDAVETEKNLPEEQEAEMASTTATIPNKGGKVADDMPFSPDHKRLECQNYIGNLLDHCQKLSEGKRKRDSDVKNIDEKAEHMKMSAAENLGQARVFESTHSFTPVGFTKDTFMQSHPQHLKAVNVGIGSKYTLAEMSGGFRSNESEVSQGIKLEVRGESNGLSANAYEQDLPKPGIVLYPVKDSKRQTPNSLEDVANVGKSSGFADKNNSDQNSSESSSGDDSCPYLKYEKAEAELKGPIMTFSQYKEYVQEFRVKYDVYTSLHKNLGSYRNEFSKMCDDLKDAKDRDVDRYNKILGQLKESYLHHGLKHKRLKKVYIVIHKELAHIRKRIQDFADANKKNNKK